MEEAKFYLGIDWGSSKIGLSLADNQNLLASPWGVVKTLDEVLATIKREDISEVIVGRPISLSGQSDKFTVGFARFVAMLSKDSGLPVHLVDERMTTHAAQKLSGDKKNKAKEDAIAAMLILQTWLDQQI